MFDFNTGTLERLSHDLDDVNGNGNLRISNGSKMSICDGMVFHNFDSIVMGSCKAPNVDPGKNVNNGFFCPVGDDPYTPPPLNAMDSLGFNRITNPDRNMIIINEGSALVLDSGSKTHVGSYSTILIKHGGTLYVKDGATLEVGDACPYDQGEVIAEDGSYFCVEEGADLHFFNDIDSNRHITQDTLDRHIVYIRKDPGGIKHATYGVNTSGARGKFLEDSMYGNHDCLEFCNWKYVNTPHGINNRAFGWCNIDSPYSRIISPDTACLGNMYYVDGHKTLNETRYLVNAFEYDTSTHNVNGGNPLGTMDTSELGQIGDTQQVFVPSWSGYYKVYLQTFNS